MKRIFKLLVASLVLVLIGVIVILFNGNIDSVTHSKGRVEKYFLFGKMLAETNYNREDQKDGLTKLYYLNGKLKRELWYQNGRLHGIAKFYGRDGQLRTEDHYRNGKKILRRKFDDQGHVVDEDRFEP